MKKKPLRIIAKNLQDLDILSACLQDALVPLKEATYDNLQKRFLCLANRYKWEEKASHAEDARIHSGLSFENIEEAQFKGFNPKEAKDQYLSLLQIRHENPYIYLIFSGEASIRLKTTDLKVKMRDAHTSWPTKTPKH